MNSGHLILITSSSSPGWEHLQQTDRQPEYNTPPTLTTASSDGYSIKVKGQTLRLRIRLPLSFNFGPVHSHEAVDGGQVVPGAQQEKGETDDDEQAAQVHEGVLSDEPPETDPPKVHRDVLTLERETQM